LVEKRKEDFVAGFSGQTSLKTKKICKEALGGILFIDEAYSLDDGQYGQDVVDTLVPYLEDHRSDFICIVAGYAEEMPVFFGMNAGLPNRFTTWIDFPYYTPPEMEQIFLRSTSEFRIPLTPAARAYVRDVISKQIKRDKKFAVGRYARNLFEAAYENMALRKGTEMTADDIRVKT
jgi:Holliday junction resolvasome RuvABC ATP-dependent DNA helicase subunit